MDVHDIEFIEMLDKCFRNGCFTIAIDKIVDADEGKMISVSICHNDSPISSDFISVDELLQFIGN